MFCEILTACLTMPRIPPILRLDPLRLFDLLSHLPGLQSLPALLRKLIIFSYILCDRQRSLSLRTIAYAVDLGRYESQACGCSRKLNGYFRYISQYRQWQKHLKYASAWVLPKAPNKIHTNATSGTFSNTR